MEINEFVTNFADQFEDTNPESITASTVFHDLEEWDSLVALAVLNMCDKKYGKKITFDQMKVCVTVQNLFETVQNAKDGDAK